MSTSANKRSADDTAKAMQPHEKKRKPEPTSFNWDDLEAPLRRKDDDANISKPLTVVAASNPDDGDDDDHEELRERANKLKQEVKELEDMVKEKKEVLKQEQLHYDVTVAEEADEELVKALIQRHHEGVHEVIMLYSQAYTIVQLFT